MKQEDYMEIWIQKKAFFPEDYSIEDRRNAFMNSRMLLGKDYGFDGHKFFMADQKD